MKVCMLTTWDSRCGIYSMSYGLVQELLKLGVDIDVISNCGWSNLTIGPYDQKEFWFESNDEFDSWGRFHIFNKMYGVKWFGESDYFNDSGIIDLIKRNKYDVLHVQYQISLYAQPTFGRFVERVKHQFPDMKLVITVHDSSCGGPVDLNKFDEVIVHRGDFVQRDAHVFPFPTIYRPLTISSFGLGRSQFKLIEDFCKKNGFECSIYNSSIDWFDFEADLLEELRNTSDAIVLDYKDTPGLKGTSSAVRLALATHRPVFVNSIGWFKDMAGLVYVFNDYDDLLLKIDSLFKLSFLKKNSTAEYAKKHLLVYERKDSVLS